MIEVMITVLMSEFNVFRVKEEKRFFPIANTIKRGVSQALGFKPETVRVILADYGAADKDTPRVFIKASLITSNHTNAQILAKAIEQAWINLDRNCEELEFLGDITLSEPEILVQGFEPWLTCRRKVILTQAEVS